MHKNEILFYFLLERIRMKYIYLLCTFKIQKEKGALEEDEKKGEKVYLPFETSYNEKGVPALPIEPLQIQKLNLPCTTKFHT